MDAQDGHGCHWKIDDRVVEKSTGRFSQGGNMKPIAALLIVCLMVLAAPMSGADCREWNTREFFKAATVEEVARCLQSGADPKARNEYGHTPLHVAATEILA